jgi:hypothetical protein
MKQKQERNRDLNGIGAACQAANFITGLHLENTLAAAASILAGQGAARASANFRAVQGLKNNEER